eukprot:Gregarina_sp_Poly_1__787@NODE_1189_length_4822_cov_141_095689_g818_i0_p3_GENE_NODE_1189_length_4822_cov_141_095689_g818_i0NODE_1189_length_4822_cov_141_095689_g818_i0_p3_ORF_typecomplete_len350_score17_81PAP2/PF01569_21/2_2e02PAP2/PF01569_21/1_6e26PAP2_3/PF14378_6/2_4e05BioY/PF02632_14/0_024BioY/PF02632_14/1_9e03FtsX/PF02687_21/4_4FtsX/PF02687_21/24FtsX/PF02687_21/2_3e03Sre/PF03125_18/33Sre/PF03125_18/8_2DUF2157/PF09925_9/0_2DUF2157/PF09925_9/8_5e02Sensor/PF13796_6/0_11Sensor/PF13796_6/2_2e03FUS
MARRIRRLSFSFDWIFISNEIILRVAVVLVGFLFHIWYAPFIREVQGKDWPDYAYPYKPHQMFSEALATLVVILVTVGIIGLTFLMLRIHGKWSHSLLLEEFIIFLLGTTLSAALDFMACTIIKKMYGRLRPDYLSRCFGHNEPTVWMAVNGFADWNAIPDIPICNTKAGTFNLSENALDDGRMSFPSAHSSLSFAIIGFLSLWTYSKLCLFRDWGAWRITIPFGLIMIPTVIAVSRTSDYRHHSSDVIGGTILGCLIAILCFCFYFPIRMTPLATTVYNAHSKRTPLARLLDTHAAKCRSHPVLPPVEPESPDQNFEAPQSAQSNIFVKSESTNALEERSPRKPETIN